MGNELTREETNDQTPLICVSIYNHTEGTTTTQPLARSKFDARV